MPPAAAAPASPPRRPSSPPITHLGVEAGTHRLDTTFGPVVIAYVGAGEGPDRTNRFVIAPATGAALLDVRYSPDELAGAPE